MRNRFALLAHRSQLGLLAALAIGCGSHESEAALADSARSRAPDTIVRRVIRIPRLPSAMQRMTGELNASQAMRPLDSALAVRVMDQRGRGMSNVRVAWTLLNPGDGAQLRIIDARTDARGMSRATFTPGRTAIPQTVVAEVTRVGRLSFRVTVPVATIRLTPDASTMWSGDEQVVSAELRDRGGAVLTGGPLVWGATDSTVLTVITSDVTRAIVRGKLPGAADLVAWIEPGTVRGSVRLRVKPIVSGMFVTLDGAKVPEMHLEVRSGALLDTIPVIDARFSKRIELPAADVELRANPVGAATHHPAQVRVATPRGVQDIRIALLPTTWGIEGGTYSGRNVPIDAVGALRRPPGSAAFWRLAPIGGRIPIQVLGWPEQAFPLRIAFNRRRSREPIVPDDSAEFWRIAEQMQRDLGSRLFMPATLHGDSVPSDLVTVEISADAAKGHTFVTWNEAGDAYDGVVMFRRAATLRDSHIVTHELLHLLGFGHTTAFPSVSQPVRGDEPRLTPEDVAHAQLAMRLRQFQRQTGARAGLPVAIQ